MSGVDPGADPRRIIRFDAQGLAPVVAQDSSTGEVLLVAFMNAEALQATLAEGWLVLWSRSRRRLWRKGERSGHRLWLEELRVNCEASSLLARVRRVGPGACHTGHRSCFYRRLEAQGNGRFALRAVEEPVFDPAAVYGTTTTAPAGHGQPDGGFEQHLRALYAAYERLRDDAVVPSSRTSALLHAPDRAATARQCLARGQEELTELRGVLAGTHRHQGGTGDVVLEASQAGYWAILAAVATNAAFDDWRPDRAWLGANEAPTGCPLDNVLTAAAALLRDAGRLCREAGVHPRSVIEADLSAMRAKHGHRGAPGRANAWDGP